jgi:hypothetical protein
MRLQDIMITEVFCAVPDEPFDQAAKRMRQENLGAWW